MFGIGDCVNSNLTQPLIFCVDHGFEAAHAGGGDILYLGVVAVVQGDGVGVDEVDRYSVADVAYQTGGGVDGQRCADDQQNVAS